MANRLAVAGPGSKYAEPGAEPAGFYAGFWHGMISPITLIVSWFDPDVRIYESKNTGRTYEFGFLLGASAALGSSGSAVA